MSPVEWIMIGLCAILMAISGWAIWQLRPTWKFTPPQDEDEVPVDSEP